MLPLISGSQSQPATNQWQPYIIIENIHDYLVSSPKKSHVLEALAIIQSICTMLEWLSSVESAPPIKSKRCQSVCDNVEKENKQPHMVLNTPE